MDSGNIASYPAGGAVQPSGCADSLRRGDEGCGTTGVNTLANYAPKGETDPQKTERETKEGKEEKSRQRALETRLFRHLGEPAGTVEDPEKRICHDLSANIYFTHGYIGDNRGGRSGGHGHSLRQTQCRHVRGDADPPGASSYAGSAHPSGAGSARGEDNGLWRGGNILPHLGLDGYRLCLRCTAYQMVPTTTQTAAKGGTRYKQTSWKG